MYITTQSIRQVTYCRICVLEFICTNYTKRLKLERANVAVFCKSSSCITAFRNDVRLLHARRDEQDRAVPLAAHPSVTHTSRYEVMNARSSTHPQNGVSSHPCPKCISCPVIATTLCMNIIKDYKDYAEMKSNVCSLSNFIYKSSNID